VTLTLADRVDAYKRAFPQWPQSWPWIVQEGAGAHRHDVAYGVWKIGQDYRNKSRFYGAYPHGYLERVMAFFPDLTPASPKSAVMHVFSGSLPPGHYERVDVLQDADTQCDVLDLPNIVLNLPPVPDSRGPAVFADRRRQVRDADGQPRQGAARARAGDSARRLARVARHRVADAPQGRIDDGRAHSPAAIDEPPDARHQHLRTEGRVDAAALRVVGAEPA
jgi:hypothetical protein